MENYVSVEVGCLRFLDSYRFLNSCLDKLVKSMQSSTNSFPIMNENGLDDELFKKKMAYPYEYLNLSNIQEPLNLSPEDFWSTLKQTTPSLEEINRTQEIIKKYDLKNGQELTMLYLKMDVHNSLMYSKTLLRSLHLNTASLLCTVTLYLVIHGKLV